MRLRTYAEFSIFRREVRHEDEQGNLASRDANTCGGGQAPVQTFVKPIVAHCTTRINASTLWPFSSVQCFVSSLAWSELRYILHQDLFHGPVYPRWLPIRNSRLDVLHVYSDTDWLGRLREHRVGCSCSQGTCSEFRRKKVYPCSLNL